MQVWVHWCGFVHVCVQMCLAGLVCLFARLCIGENMYVCVHMCVELEMPSRTPVGAGCHEECLPIPWFIRDNRNFLELRAPGMTVSSWLAPLVKKKKRERKGPGGASVGWNIIPAPKGFGFDSQWGCVWETTNRCFSGKDPGAVSWAQTDRTPAWMTLGPRVLSPPREAHGEGALE